jgi:hypothetical protein
MLAPLAMTPGSAHASAASSAANAGANPKTDSSSRSMVLLLNVLLLVLIGITNSFFHAYTIPLTIPFSARILLRHDELPSQFPPPFNPVGSVLVSGLSLAYAYACQVVSTFGSTIMNLPGGRVIGSSLICVGSVRSV